MDDSKDKTLAVPMMACGHAANATRDGEPACVICAGIDPRAYIVAEPPDLTGRVARCSPNAAVPGSGHAEKPSSLDLAFFQYRGEGSRAATKACKHCGYFEVAHKPGRGKYVCGSFEPHGPYECDVYYCGCRGWD